jgi:DNA-binding response OmpR family regulator
MSFTYLAIDKDDAVHERESTYWLSRNVSSIQTVSMNEGIEKASNNHFLFIGINADNINYKPKLKLLRDVTNDPIFIATSLYTKHEHVEAHRLGADLFGEAFESPEGNYEAVTVKLNQLNERINQRKPCIKIVTFNDILIAPVYHKAFINDTELHLSKAEMDIIYHLMINRGCFLSQKQLLQKIYGDVYDESSPDSIYSLIKRLRKKMKAVNQFDYIESIRDVGYRLIVQSAETGIKI